MTTKDLRATLSSESTSFGICSCYLKALTEVLLCTEHDVVLESSVQRRACNCYCPETASRAHRKTHLMEAA